MTLYTHNNAFFEAMDEIYVMLHEFSQNGTVHEIFIPGGKVHATFVCSTTVIEDSRYAGPVVLYKNTQNEYFIAPKFEFEDGRFKKV